MDRSAPALQLEYETLPLEKDAWGQLFRELLLLAFPVFAEHALHILVGWNDTYLANHIHRYVPATAQTRADEVAAGAAVGTMTYILWLVSLLVSAVAIGSTAIIARAVGAKHRRLANSICGQSISLAVIIGVVAGVLMYIFAPGIARVSGLE
ncbi:MAG TPA: MATE family efflux transporter, partial [Tepidisphaeraceae bacterium]